MRLAAGLPTKQSLTEMPPAPAPPAAAAAPAAPKSAAPAEPKQSGGAPYNELNSPSPSSAPRVDVLHHSPLPLALALSPSPAPVSTSAPICMPSLPCPPSAPSSLPSISRPDPLLSSALTSPREDSLVKIVACDLPPPRAVTPMNGMQKAVVKNMEWANNVPTYQVTGRMGGGKAW